MKWFLILLLSSMFSSFLIGHPVIWKKGLVFTTRFSDSMSDYRSHYSITNKWASGIHGLRLNQDNFVMLQNNYLLNRWNKPGSQGNLYIFSGFGTNVNDESSIFHFGVQTDWETRLIYTQLSYDSYFMEESIYKLNARVGVSPYLAEYSFLHSWIILQIDTIIQGNSQVTNIIPVFRFFKHNYLVEIGNNFKNSYLFTLMVHI